MTSPAEAFEKLLAVLDRIEIPYFVGGSVAGSSYGLPRTTMDVDLVVDLKEDRIEEFTTLLEAPRFGSFGKARKGSKSVA
jgi:hypothetical protein